MNRAIYSTDLRARRSYRLLLGKMASSGAGQPYGTDAHHGGKLHS